MLTLGVKDGEWIAVGDVRLKLKLTGKNAPRIVFDAPPDVRIKRLKGETVPGDEGATNG